MGVPAPLFMSWPDLYFHTQLLTAEYTDPLVFERAGRVLGSLAVGIARAGWAEAAPIMQEVANRAVARIGRVARDALASMARDGSVPGRVRTDVRWLVRRDAAAIRSAVQLVHESGHKDGAEALAATLVADLEARGTAVLATLQSGEVRDTGKPSATPRLEGDGCRAVPRRKLAQLSPGVVGLGYDEMARLVEAMQAEDERVNWETLRIFGDELWNFSDGRRTIGEIAHAVCVEFGFQVHPQHFLTLAEGFQRANVLTLQEADG
jgi:hypothetical protein